MLIREKFRKILSFAIVLFAARHHAAGADRCRPGRVTSRERQRPTGLFETDWQAVLEYQFTIY